MRQAEGDESGSNLWLVLGAIGSGFVALLLVAAALGTWSARGRSQPPRRRAPAAEPLSAVAEARVDEPAESEPVGAAPAEPDRPTSAADRAGVWRAEIVDLPYVSRLLGVGAKADIVPGTRVEPATHRAYVELSVFAEGEFGRWETELLDGGVPFAVGVDDLEASVRRIVVPGRLETLARTLRRDGLDLEVGDLAMLPFMLEIAPGLEVELIRRRIGDVSPVAH